MLSIRAISMLSIRPSWQFGAKSELNLRDESSCAVVPNKNKIKIKKSFQGST